VRNIGFSVDGTPTIAYTLVPGDSVDVPVTGSGAFTLTYGASDDQLVEASPQTQEFSIAGASQTITFVPPTGFSYGADDVDPGASASSGLPVTVVSTTTGVCTVVAGKVHAVAAGSCSLTATQAGNASWAAAPEVSVTFAIGKAALRVTAPDVAMTAGGPPPTVVPSYSGLVGADTAASLDTAPTCAAVLATRTTHCSGGADTDYAFTYLDGTLTVNPVGQTVRLGAPPVVTYASPSVPVTGTSDAGLPVTLTAGPADVCSVTSGSLQIHHAGRCTLSGVQPGDATHLAGSATLVVTVHAAPLTITAASVATPKKGRTPAVAASYAGLVRGDDVFDLDTRPSCAVDRAHRRTQCAGAGDRDYDIAYRPGRMTVARSGFAFANPSVAYAGPGHPLALRLALLGRGRPSIKVAGRLPKGLALRHNKAWTKVSLVGTPTAGGTLRLTAKKGSRTVAKQALTIVAPG